MKCLHATPSLLLGSGRARPESVTCWGSQYHVQASRYANPTSPEYWVTPRPQSHPRRSWAALPLMATTSVAIQLVGEEGEDLAATMEIAEGNQLLAFSMPKPLGIVLEESEDDGSIVVMEVVDGGNAQACGVQEGDILLAVTARSQDEFDPGFMKGMRKRTKQTLFGQQVLVKTAGEEFETVMSAIASNRCSQCTIQVVVERPVSGQGS